MARNMKIITILGARPQFIKAATLSEAIRQHNRSTTALIEDIIVHTGQHFDHNMSQVFFDEMEITPPRYSLGVNSSTHGVMTGQMMLQIDEILLKEKPDYVLVYGDTNSTLAGALCGAKLHFPIVHVEAGLRSFNKQIPEEINRVLTDQISDLLFCPSEQAVTWLKNEGIKQNVFNVGDVMVDSALFFSKRLPTKTAFDLRASLPKSFVTVTLHRAGNTDDPSKLTEIIRALRTISEEAGVLFLIHPRTKKRVEELKIEMGSIVVSEPMGYSDLLYFVKESTCVLTDSGGLQKESYFLGKPCVILREETEWVELVESGASKLAGSNFNKILSAFRASVEHMIADKGIYGDGRASARILQTIVADFKKRNLGRDL